jgi:undecaprenyl-diphosphatase
MNGNEQPERKSRSSRQAVWIGVILLGIVAAAVSYVFVDPVVSAWLQNHPNTWHRNEWVNGFRQLGKAGVPIWLLLIWSCLTGRWRPTAVTVAALVLIGVSVPPLKAIVRRCRPSTVVEASQQSLSLQEIAWHKKASFPSGDAAVAFAVATTLSSSLGRLWAPAFFAAAGAVGLLRVTALAHYPSDVMAGALIGVLCGVYALRWMARWCEGDGLRVKRKWRIVVLLILVFVVPFAGPRLGLTALQIFLRAFTIPLLVLVPICWAVVQLQAWKGSPTPSVPLGSPAPKSDPLREPMS